MKSIMLCLPSIMNSLEGLITDLDREKKLIELTVEVEDEANT